MTLDTAGFTSTAEQRNKGTYNTAQETTNIYPSRLTSIRRHMNFGSLTGRWSGQPQPAKCLAMARQFESKVA